MQAYSFLNLIAEKFRSLLQQPTRKRNRRQDVYNIHLLITSNKPLSTDEKNQLLHLTIGSCKERGIDAHINSFSHPEVKKMAEKGYEDLAPEIDGPLPSFYDAYAKVQ